MMQSSSAQQVVATMGVCPAGLTPAGPARAAAHFLRTWGRPASHGTTASSSGPSSPLEHVIGARHLDLAITAIAGTLRHGRAGFVAGTQS
jgi:hypothetical protein